MHAARAALAIFGLIAVAGCGSTASPAASTQGAATSAVDSPSPTNRPSMRTAVSPGPSSSDSAQDLPVTGDLPPGRFTFADFKPRITFNVEDGWTVGSAAAGFFDVQRWKGTPDVIAVQFGLVEGIVGAGGSMTQPKTAAEAGKTIHENAGIVVIEESESRMSGLKGSNVVVENRSKAHSEVLQVAPGTLGIDPGRRLWISLFDTPDGIVAVMVGGSVAKWDEALAAAEPVLESVTIGQAP